MAVLLGLLLPPHEVRAAAIKKRANVTATRLALELQGKPASTNPMLGNQNANAVIEKFEPAIAAIVAVVEIVIVEIAAALPGVTAGGEKEHELRAGRPAHESCTGCGNPPGCGVMVIIAVTDCPADIDKAETELVIRKSAVTVMGRLAELEAAKLLSPTYDAEKL